MKMFTLEKALEDGAFGRVFRAKKAKARGDAGNSDPVAIKAFFVLRKVHQIHGVINLREVDAMKRCSHPNLMNVIEVHYDWPFQEDIGKQDLKHSLDHVYTVMPLAMESSYYYLRDPKCRIVVTHLKRMMLQIAHGVQYLHSNGIAHRDLKSTNILLFPNPNHRGLIDAVLCDFGMAKPLTPNYVNSTYVGTAIYRPPEILLGIGNYSFSADIWSLGVLFFELMNNAYPFDGKSDIEVLTALLKIRGAPTKEVFMKLVDGNKDCLIDYEKVKRWKGVSLKTIFRMEHYPMSIFDQGIAERSGAIPEDPVPNFGTLDQFTKLLEGMLEMDPSRRLGSEDVLSAEFFESLPWQDDPETATTATFREFGLVKERPATREKVILKKIDDDELRKTGINNILYLNSTFDANVWRIIFLAIDVYDRALLKAEESFGVGKVNAEQNKYIAVTSCYIATKYFLDESCPSLTKLFPRHRYDAKKIVKWEKVILVDWLDWNVYRPTVYDLLRDKVAPAILLNVFRNHPEIYGEHGADVNDVAEIFAEEVKQHL